MKKAKLNKSFKKERKFNFFYFLILVFIAYILFFNLKRSAFFTKKDRINIVYAGEKLAYYSIGLNDSVNYFIPFFPDLEVMVPGGYAYYRLGALGKLVELEKKPDLYKQTYSSVTSSMVDFYFYPSTRSASSGLGQEIFFGKEKSGFFLPRAGAIFFGNSNANLFDRIYVYLRLFGKTRSQFKIINSLSTADQGKRIAFLSDEFFAALQGIFYKKTYRKEQRDVQIIYNNSYNTALQLAQILEGEGIRVVDLTQTRVKSEKCLITEDARPFSQTANSLSRFFGCSLVSGPTEAYDIILKLGKAEKEWDIN